MKNATKVRANVMFPVDVFERLRELVPAGERSAFVAEATVYKLKMLRQARAIQQAAGAWTDENHPDLMKGEDRGRWREEMDRADDERWKRLFGTPQGEPESGVPAG